MVRRNFSLIVLLTVLTVVFPIALLAAGSESLEPGSRYSFAAG